MNELKLLEKLTKEVTKHNITTERLILALDMLKRIKEIYPYIFGECVIDEELSKLLGK